MRSVASEKQLIWPPSTQKYPSEEEDVIDEPGNFAHDLYLHIGSIVL